MHKPRAEMGVILHRSPPSNPLGQISFSKRMETDKATASKLMEILLQILDRITKCMRQKTDFWCLAKISSCSPSPSARNVFLIYLQVSTKLKKKHPSKSLMRFKTRKPQRLGASVIVNRSLRTALVLISTASRYLRMKWKISEMQKVESPSYLNKMTMSSGRLQTHRLLTRRLQMENIPPTRISTTLKIGTMSRFQTQVIIAKSGAISTA